MTPCQALINPTEFHTVSFTIGGECERHQARFPIVAMTLDVHIDERDDISGMSFDWCINKSVYINVTANTERRARSLVKAF